MADPIPTSAVSSLDPWESSTWEGHARWQLARTLAATPLERLLWLEEALALAWASGALPRRPPATDRPPEPVRSASSA